MVSPITELFKHNLWANHAALDACAKLTDEQLDATMPGTYGTIRNTLVHILGAQERYVDLLNSRGPAPEMLEQKPFPGFDRLHLLCDQSGQALIRLAEAANGDETLHGKRRNGTKIAVAITVVLTQAINHATEHRAHINTTLTQLGIEPPELDGWAYGQAHGQIELS